MNSSDKGGGTKVFTVLGWLTAAASVLFIVCIIVWIAQYTQSSAQTIAFADVFMLFMYQFNAWLVCITAAWMLAMLLLKNKRALLSRVFVWCAMVVALLYASMAFQQMYSYWPQMVVEGRFNMLSAYVPSICAAVALIVLAASWDSTRKKAANRVSMVCAVVAVFMAVLYLSKYAVPQQGAELQTLMSLGSAISITLVSVDIWYLTLSRRIFDCVVYAMTEEDALLVESVEDRVHQAMEKMEDEVMEELAQKDKEEAENSIADPGEEAGVQEADNEDAAEQGETLGEKLGEVREEIEENIEQVNAQLLGDEEEK